MYLLRIRSRRVRFRILLQHTNPRELYESRHSFSDMVVPYALPVGVVKDNAPSIFREAELST